MIHRAGPRFVPLVVLLLAACSGGPSAPSLNIPFSTTDLVAGTGAVAATGNRVAVNYTGWLYDPNAPDNKGRRFDSSLDPGRIPFSFVIGSGGAIPGFEQGVVGMATGGTRRIVIPPHLGYGSTANGSIPANSTLIFEVTLVGVS